MILIDKNVKHAYHIQQTFEFCRIACSLWDSDGAPLFLLEGRSPVDIIIYCDNTNRKHEILALKQRKREKLIVIFEGEDSGQKLADVVIGTSARKPCVDQFDHMVYPLYFPKSPAQGGRKLGMTSLTDGLGPQLNQEAGLAIQHLISAGTKFFGSTNLKTVNYLGNLRPNERTLVIQSSDLYIDIEGTLWPSVASKGVRVAVLSERALPVDTFSSPDEFDKIRQSEVGYNQFILSQELINKTSFDMCSIIMSLLNNRQMSDHLLSVKAELQ